MITLKPKTDQEAFDFAVEFIKGRTNKMRCVYLDEDGQRCVISGMMGCSDEDLRTLPTENNSVIDLVFGDFLDTGDISMSLLQDIQVVFDSGVWVGGFFMDWYALEQLAFNWGLDSSLIGTEKD